MLRSRANTLLSVRRVTERNAGRLTAGVDGEVVLTPQAKARLADRVHQNTEPFKALPVRRVYIPKRGSATKRRPLGIPVIADRAHQARVVSALEPEWEARFEPRSYGFRPGRGCHDAIESAYHAVKGKDPKRRWVLDADLAQAFDQLGHDHILNQLGTFPARGMIRQWLKAGVVEQGRLHRTEAGVPQGGVVSPVLLNVALHGIEKAAFDAVKIRCRSRRTSSSIRRQLIWRQSKGASSGPFTTTSVVASNLSSGSGALVIFPSTGSPDRVSALSRPGTRPDIRPVIRDDRLEETAIASRFPVAFRLPAFRFSVIRFPPRSWALLAVGLPGKTFLPGPRRGYRVPHA